MILLFHRRNCNFRTAKSPERLRRGFFPVRPDKEFRSLSQRENTKKNIKHIARDSCTQQKLDMQNSYANIHVYILI